jgi:PilZ domain
MVQKKLRPSAQAAPGRLIGDPQRSQRRERRCPLSVLLGVCGFSASGRIFSEMAGTHNISPSGCRVRLRTQPLENTALALQVIPREGPLPEGGAQLLYQVVWLRQQGQAWDVGLLALGDTDLLRVAFASHKP